ncbi:unnamed protein product, partial [marine sediment metagenome]
ADYTCLDVNSMYGYVMKEYQYPFNLRTTGRKLALKELPKILAHQCIIAEVLLNTPEPLFSVRHDNRLIFPVGSFRTTLTTEELKYAYEHGYIVECYKYAIYDRALLFGDYVNFFYDQRMKYQASGNKPFAAITKLFQNSLYGKFGQHNDEWSTLGEDTESKDFVMREYDAQRHCWVECRSINGRIEECTGKVLARHAMVAIPAHVTANARLFLMKRANIAGYGNYFLYRHRLFMGKHHRQRTVNGIYTPNSTWEAKSRA